MTQTNNIQEKSYDRIYLTKYRQELEKHKIDIDVETFINIAFNEKLERTISKQTEEVGTDND